MKSFQLKPGIIICTSISMLLSLRRVFIKDENLSDALHVVAYTLPFALCCWLLNQYIIQQRPPFQKVQHTVAKLLLSILGCIVLSWLNDQFFPMWSMFEASITGSRRILIYMIRGFVIGSLQFFIIYYFRMLEGEQQARMEIEILKKEKLEAKLLALRQQISPHFLFNSLNTLKTITPDPISKQYVVQLASVYRYLLSYNENNLATLQDELSFTRSYLYILQQRFEDALLVHIKLDEDHLQKKIPLLSLQLLVENAVKHNIVSVDDPLQIRIYTETPDLLVVENNLQARLSTTDNTGMGLNNINDRYRLLAGREISILQSDATFTVKIPLLS